MNYANYNGLISVCREWLKTLPEFDVYVGIPRSGCIPALIIALYRNKPFMTLQEFLLGLEPKYGKRYRESREIKKVLILDDSFYSGMTWMEAKKQIEEKHLQIKYDIHYGAVFTSSKVNTHNFHSAMEIPQPRAFEWNILAHDPQIRHACFDMDGVLCVAPTPEQNDDGPAYEAFIKATKPLYKPYLPIKAIITCRLEKYRQMTQDWLREQGIQYEQLIMMPYPTARERQEAGRHAEYKAEKFMAIPESWIFFEDEPAQAQKIAELTRKPVICVKNWGLIR